MNQLLKTKGKLLGVDFGDKRTGLAISNDMRTLASGITQISVGGMQKTAAAVAQVAKDRAVVGVVVGLPVNMDGSHGPRAQHAEKFAGLLREALTALAVEIPVVMQDERMTTMAASRYLNETDTKGAKRKGVIDTLSAEIILQNALDKLRFMRERAEAEAAESPAEPHTTDTEEET
jgi:putative Holliday junction resolvase